MVMNAFGITCQAGWAEPCLSIAPTSSMSVATSWSQLTLNASMIVRRSREQGVWATARLNFGDEFRSLSPMVRGTAWSRCEISVY